MRIVIVGGGSSGWMTAAAFCKTFPNWDITIITGGESIGVGESTTPHLNQYLKYMGITDEVFLPAARATYKSSSRFEGFVSEGQVFHYPNGQSVCGDIQYHQWMLGKAFYPDICPPFADMFMPFVTVAEEGKLPLDHELIAPYKLSKDRSFHINASAFAEFLQGTFCIKATHIQDMVKRVVRRGKHIDKLIMTHGHEIFGDLFIDCTGQSSALIESPWIPFDTILNDTALVVKHPYEDKKSQMLPYTNAKAMSSGWQWTIPTWDFISRGYVFSSKHQKLEDAKKEFGHEDPKVIKFRNGRHENAWVGNTVAIGLSYGFIEPLESTSLFNTHHGILALMDILREESLPGQFARDRYNYNLAEHMDGWREFVEAHYYYSSRRDTPYWRDATDAVEYLQVGTHESVRHIMTSGDPIPTGHMPIAYILAGSGFTNINKRHYEYFGYPNLVSESEVKMWARVYENRKKLAETMPTMYDYLSGTFNYREG